MVETFNLIFKGLVSVLIMYIAGNSIFRYHASIRLIPAVACLIGICLAFFFFDTTYYLAMAICYGIILVVSILTSLILLNRKEDIHLLVSIYDKDSELFQTKTDELGTQLGISSASISFFFGKFYLLCLHGVNHKKRKPFMKSLDSFLSKQPLRFTLVQYLHIMVALILLAAIWRF